MLTNSSLNEVRLDTSIEHARYSFDIRRMRDAAARNYQFNHKSLFLQQKRP